MLTAIAIVFLCVHVYRCVCARVCLRTLGPAVCIVCSVFELSHVHICVQFQSGCVAIALASFVNKLPTCLGRTSGLGIYLAIRTAAFLIPLCL